MRSQGSPAWAAAFLVAFALVPLGCSRFGETAKPRRRAPHKVFLVGFDGMDPTLARRFMAEGKVPNLSQLARGRDLLAAPDDAAVRVADGVGELRHRRQPGQAGGSFRTMARSGA